MTNSWGRRLIASALSAFVVALIVHVAMIVAVHDRQSGEHDGRRRSPCIGQVSNYFSLASVFALLLLFVAGILGAFDRWWTALIAGIVVGVLAPVVSTLISATSGGSPFGGPLLGSVFGTLLGVNLLFAAGHRRAHADVRPVAVTASSRATRDALAAGRTDRAGAHPGIQPRRRAHHPHRARAGRRRAGRQAVGRLRRRPRRRPAGRPSRSPAPTPSPTRSSSRTRPSSSATPPSSPCPGADSAVVRRPPAPRPRCAPRACASNASRSRERSTAATCSRSARPSTSAAAAAPTPRASASCGPSSRRSASPSSPCRSPRRCTSRPRSPRCPTARSSATSPSSTTRRSSAASSRFPRRTAPPSSCSSDDTVLMSSSAPQSAALVEDLGYTRRQVDISRVREARGLRHLPLHPHPLRPVRFATRTLEVLLRSGWRSVIGCRAA